MKGVSPYSYFPIVSRTVSHDRIQLITNTLSGVAWTLGVKAVGFLSLVMAIACFFSPRQSVPMSSSSPRTPPPPPTSSLSIPPASVFAQLSHVPCFLFSRKVSRLRVEIPRRLRRGR